MGKGQMEHRRKFTETLQSVRKVERDREGGDQSEPQGPWKVEESKQDRKTGDRRAERMERVYSGWWEKSGIAGRWRGERYVR